LKEDSEFTLVIPKDDIAIIERKGVIEFVDYTGRYSKIMTRNEEDEDTTRAELTGIDLNANIEINRDSKLKIVVDEVAGDSLVLFGDATLSFGIDPSGKISLTGRYEIVEGTYQMTFYVRRKFNIRQGSSLTWAGNPLDARVDITAIYDVKTAPLDLMASQISGTDEAQQNRYKQKLPFEVHLNMLGNLMTPDISFDIELATEERGGDVGATVTAKLDQLSANESELNKQVFALLVLERFLPEDPLALSGGGGGAEGIARESVSRLLGQQLNRLAGKYITGFELNVGLESYEDYSTGEEEGRTELAVGVSKQFFNERIKVDVGSNFDLEGERARKSNLSTIAGDVSIEYKLTEDGRFRLRGFRESIYEGIIEGEIVETGLGVVYTKDYNNLRDLFKREREDDSFKRRD
ncbi:MAG: translocation/assembly module TamB domain-containing protein, partial [Bacteroidia bacterium]